MSDRMSVTETKVPLLGDIPLLGYLFKYTRKEKVKTNLLIFLTPYVIKDQSDLQSIFEQKVQERREFVAAYSSLEDRELEGHVDYRRKRGLLEEINKAILTSDEEERQLREALESRQLLHEEGAVELPPEMRATDPGSAPAPDIEPPPEAPPPPPEGD
jgi:general secretion pathway protein D